MKGGTCHGRDLLRREEDVCVLRNSAKSSFTGSTVWKGRSAGSAGWWSGDSYCTDILTQSAAVQAALNAFNRELIAAHLHSCVARDLREGKDEVIDELVLTLQKLMK